jgi:hypothetical protein
MDNPELAHTLEGLKFISDWSKWLVTLVTGAATVLGLIFKLQGEGHTALPEAARCFAFLTFLFFFLSVLFAAGLLYKLPGIAQRLSTHYANEDLYFMGSTYTKEERVARTLRWYEWFRITGFLMGCQQGLFVVGLLFFLITVGLITIAAPQ